MRDTALREGVASVLRSQGVAHQQLVPTSDGLFVADIALPGACFQHHAVMHGSMEGQHDASHAAVEAVQ